MHHNRLMNFACIIFKFAPLYFLLISYQFYHLKPFLQCILHLKCVVFGKKIWTVTVTRR